MLPGMTSELSTRINNVAPNSKYAGRQVGITDGMKPESKKA
jgi:hypothetical protein